MICVHESMFRFNLQFDFTKKLQIDVQEAAI